MGVVTRPDSPFYWLNLERPGQRPIRESTQVLVKGATPTQTRDNRQLAEALYNARKGDLARQRHQLPIDRARTSFKTYRVWYLENISVHKRNQIREASMLRQLATYFDPYDLTAIDLDVGRTWRTARSKEVAPATVNREAQLLKHLMGTAVPKYLDRNPLSGLEMLRIPETEPRILEPDEETRLLLHGLVTDEDRALVLCALDTLQRLSSVADLKRAQDHGTHLTFLNTKTKGGKVPVSTRLRRALDALSEDGPYYFPSVQVGSVTARRCAITRMFYEACQRARLPVGQKADGLTFHCLRHTGASRMLERGVDIETVRRIGGWANLDVLQRYLHPSDEASRRAVEVIGAPFHTRDIHVGRRGTANRTNRRGKTRARV